MNHSQQIVSLIFIFLFGVVFSSAAQQERTTVYKKKYEYKKRTAEEKARYFTKKMVDSLTVTEAQEDSLYLMNIVVSEKFDSLKNVVDGLDRRERSAAYRSIYKYRDDCMRAILPRKEFLKFLDIEREKWERKKAAQRKERN